MVEKQIQLARKIASLFQEHEGYEILPEGISMEDVFIVALFRSLDPDLNNSLVKRINATSKIYVSGTSWNGRPACRFAISNWQVDVGRDIDLISSVLDDVYNGFRNQNRET